VSSVEEHDWSALARELIDGGRFMALGTADADGRPWVSPVWYAPEDYRAFFWVSKPEAQHSGNIAARPEVAIVIFDSRAPGTATSVYMAATAEEVTGAEVERGLGVFNARSVEQGLREWTLDDVRPPARHRLFRATVAEHWVLGPGDERMPADP
jgi:pyridoxine/pyridoxamine 5'-phosphate oxidase